MKVFCHTNLDLHKAESWPKELESIPRVGDLIQSKFQHKPTFRLSLQVTCVHWEYYENTDSWIPCIELHMTDFQKKLPARREGAAEGSIIAFYEWYAPLTGGRVADYI